MEVNVTLISKGTAMEMMVNRTVKSNYRIVKFTDWFIMIFSLVLQVWFDVS